MRVLEGKVIIVTGAGGGIGRCHALAAAREGASVVINDLGGARDGTGAGATMAEKVVAEIVSMGGRAVANFDSVTDRDGCERMVEAAIGAWGRLDGVVNNAGILRDRTFGKMTPEEWDVVLDVHLTGTRNLCWAALDALKARGGAIVNTTSVSGLIGNFGQSNYAAAKAGIYGLSRVLAMELRKYSVTVNCVAPVAKTRMTDDLPQVEDQWRPEQISPIVTFLLSDAGREHTGLVFGVQGQRIHLYQVKISQGVTKPGAELWTVDEIARQFTAITRWSEEMDPFVSEGRSLKAPLTTGTPTGLGEAGWPIGKTYDGGVMTLSGDAFRAYAEATDDGNEAYTGDHAVAPPMFHVVPVFPTMMLMARDPELGMDLLRLVHGEHAMSFHRPLRAGDRLAVTGKLASVSEKPSGTIFAFDLYGRIDGELALEGKTAYFIRARNPPARETKQVGPAAPEASAVVAPEPDLVITQHVALDQADRYAPASGDRNPIHLDDAVATKAGLPGVILHGLCTMAFAQRDVIRELCDGDPTRLRHIGVRFARPVFPGETLSLQLWRDGNDIRFQTDNGAGKPVITHGRAVIG